MMLVGFQFPVTVIVVGDWPRFFMRMVVDLGLVWVGFCGCGDGWGPTFRVGWAVSGPFGLSGGFGPVRWGRVRRVGG